MTSQHVVRHGNKHERQPSHWPWVFWLLAIVAGAMWWMLFNSAWFVATQVKVQGNDRVATETILSATQVELNIPLISIQTASVHDALAEFPEFKSVTVERGWPHTVLITVAERNPVAVAQLGTKFVLVDETGATSSKPSAKPQLKMVPIVGKPDTPAMQAGVAVLRGLPKDWKVKSVVASTQDSVVVTLPKGVTIEFGSGDRVDYKVKVANALIANDYRDINVSAPDAPTVRD